MRNVSLVAFALLAGLPLMQEPAVKPSPQRIRDERNAAGITATISQLDGSRAKAFVFAKG